MPGTATLNVFEYMCIISPVSYAFAKMLFVRFLPWDSGPMSRRHLTRRQAIEWPRDPALDSVRYIICPPYGLDEA